MQCPRCQHENRPQAKFCEECATPLARNCPHCGTELSARAKFCPECAPLCLALEDLHWIDSETQGFLDSLIESLPTARLLLLVNYRPEYQHGWGSKSDWKLTLLSPVTMGLLGYVYAMSGRVAEGLPLLHEAISACESLGLALLHSLLVVRLGEAHMLEGRLDDALAVAGRALMRARERSERSSEAWALRLLGEIASHRDPPDVGKAESDYRQALALADELGMRPLVARCHLGLGTLYRRKGWWQQAQDHLTTATSMFREMDMRFWLEQAEAEMAAVR